jgi:V8-like Glu-specific endopeptidase
MKTIRIAWFFLGIMVLLPANIGAHKVDAIQVSKAKSLDKLNQSSSQIADTLELKSKSKITLFDDKGLFRVNDVEGLRDYQRTQLELALCGNISTQEKARKKCLDRVDARLELIGPQIPEQCADLPNKIYAAQRSCRILQSDASCNAYETLLQNSISVCYAGPEEAELPSPLVTSRKALAVTASIGYHISKEEYVHVCSGVFLGRKRLLTAKHCLNDRNFLLAVQQGLARASSIASNDGKMFSINAVPSAAEWSNVSVHSDAMILSLQAEPSKLSTIQLIQTPDANSNLPIFVAGTAQVNPSRLFPSGRMPIWSPNNSCKFLDSSNSYGTQATCFRFACRTTKGSSGAPIFKLSQTSIDAPLELLGIVSGEEDDSSLRCRDQDQKIANVTVAHVPREFFR